MREHAPASVRRCAKHELDGGRTSAGCCNTASRVAPAPASKTVALLGEAADTGFMRCALGRWLVSGMAVVAIVVQIGVWGATKIHIDGALLESWQPYFGWQYGLVFGAVQVGLCRWVPIERGTVWLARTWAVTGGALLALWTITGMSASLTVDNGVAFTVGMGALLLAAGLHEGDLVAGAVRRPVGGTSFADRSR